MPNLLQRSPTSTVARRSDAKCHLCDPGWLWNLRAPIPEIVAWPESPWRRRHDDAAMATTQ
eukprot:7421419-Alexandrium_andersonii.AAC.1